ncbi:MAG: NAD(P)-dependent oxidoreductase [Synergistaceae bacterium]|nr:NAD(P)-dependent oxidoreductase [Synergistaceae bacterium]
MNKLKILVTGAGGYLGSAVAEYLSCSGFDVTGTFRHKKPVCSYRLVCADLSEPLNLNEDFDVIVHTAGEKPVRKSELAEYQHQDFISFKKNNIDSMHNILRFAENHRVRKIIYLSTIGVYGQIRGKILTENSDIVNPDAYGITKYAAEMILNSSRLVQGINLRLPGVISKDANGIWLANVIRKMQCNEKIVVYSPDFVTKNFVWINDLCRFIKILAESNENFKYDTVLIACKEGISVRNMISLMLKLTKSKSEIVIDNSVRTPFCIDASRAHDMGYVSLSPEEIAKEYIRIV